MIVLLALLTSILLGITLRKYRIVRHLGKTATLTVWLLIFVFGISLGSNKEIVSDFGRMGVTAVIVALMGVSGYVLTQNSGNLPILAMESGLQEKALAD